MPEETEVQKTMGRLKTGDDAKFSDPESLQRALEIEVVSQLREQNARLMEELETYRQLKHTPKSGDGSSQSWVEIRDVQSGDGIDGQGCKTPRNTVNVGKCGEIYPKWHPSSNWHTTDIHRQMSVRSLLHMCLYLQCRRFQLGCLKMQQSFWMGMNLFIKLQRCGLSISSGNLVVGVQRNQHQVKLGHCGWKEKFKLCGIP